MRCPKCGHTIAAKLLAKSLGAKGGSSGKGKAKARTSEQAAKAARARWAKAKGQQ